MSSLFINPFVRPLGVDGRILPFGKLYFYLTGTLDEAPVYDEDGDELDQPILADITGAFPNVFLDDATTYRARLENAAGVEQGDVDPYGAATPPSENIGLFIDAGDLTISADIAESSGHSVEGIGRARYQYDAEVDAAFVTAWPQFSFIDQSGRGFRIAYDQVLTPLMVGAIPASSAVSTFVITALDNLAECQALIDFAETIDPNLHMLELDFSVATWGLSDTLVITGAYYRSHVYRGGRFQYTGASPLTNLIEVDGNFFVQLVGIWYLFGLQTPGLALMADRVVDNGIRFQHVNNGYFGEFYGGNFRRFLIDSPDDGSAVTNNNIGLMIQRVHAVGCGSFGRGGYGVSSAFTATHTGSGNDDAQRSILTLASQTLYDDLEVHDVLVFKGEPYRVVAKTDDALRKVSIFPWITSPSDPTTNVNSGTIWGHYGGAIRLRHNNTEGIRIIHLTGRYCGTVIKQMGQYGVSVGDMLGENVGSTFELGIGTSNICRGLVIDNYHTEGSSSQTEVVDAVTYAAGFEGIWLTQLRCEMIINHVSAMWVDNDSSVLSGFRIISKQSTDALIGADTATPQGLRINFNGKVLSSSGGRPKSYGAADSPRQMTNSQDGREEKLSANTIALTTFYDAPADRMCARANWWECLVVGTGSNGAPTGDVTVARGSSDATAGYTINGGTSTVTFAAGASRARRIFAYFDAATEDWIVKDIAA